jgi:sulfite dehydrogenase (quinone) subunit SoeC
MHPAYSVIVFTTTSGAGYGLLFWLGLRTALPHDGAAVGWSDLIALTIGLSLATLGLLSSALHLGRPTRAWRAFSQWRTSWLSREAVAAMVTYVPAGLLGLGWLWPGLVPALPLFGLLLAAGAAATVWCTGMIYGCLRTIPAWNLARVIDAAAGGAAQFQAAVSAVSVGAGLALKLSYWSHIDTATLGQDRASALGIPGASRIRPLDPPHTQPNFVMREMGYQVARRHADRLRLICKVLLTLSTAALLLAAVLPGATLPLAALAVMVAAPAVFMERWLFFAQARHLSMLYY